jgi:hypothetical protein
MIKYYVLLPVAALMKNKLLLSLLCPYMGFEPISVQVLGSTA